MCGCPTHVIETASQLASTLGYYGPTLGTVGAAFIGGRFGRLLLRLTRLASRSSHVPNVPEG